MTTPLEPKGYEELKAEFEEIKTRYDGTDHAERVHILLQAKNLTIDRIVIMRIWETGKGWWQLAFIETLASLLNVDKVFYKRIIA